MADQDQEWLPAPPTPALMPVQVHVWRAALDIPTPLANALEGTLSPDEQARAARFRFPLLRQRFVAGCGILRAILGRYLGMAPQTLQFGYTAHGKPFLQPGEGRQALRFNMAHTEGVALYAIAHTREVGIDIEMQRPLSDALAIAEQFFSPLERHMLQALPPQEQPAAFLRCWTRKEAYVKGLGVGLSLPLDQFSVTLTPHEPAQLLRTEHDPAAVTQWAIRELAAGPGYIAALAVEGEDWQLSCWQWPE
jgi:4'-phosphopantetheinyl transferase